MRLGETYLGKPHRNNSWLIEIIAVLATMGLIGIQVGLWVAMALTSYRIWNCGKDLV